MFQLYAIGGVAIVILLLLGGLKLEHGRVLTAQAETKIARGQVSQCKAANVSLKQSCDALDEKYKGSQKALEKLGKDDAARAAASKKRLAELAAKDAGSQTTIDALREEAAKPHPGEDINARARDILRKYSVDSLRDNE